MKKLNTNNAGRMPLWQADLDWIQKGYTEPLTALVEELGLSKSYFAITGCVPYKPNIKTLAMPAGWFWWNGQILPVRELKATDVLSYTNPVVRLTRVTYTNPEGARNFIHADLSTENVSNVWQDDYLSPTVVERSAGFTSGVRLGIGAWTLRDILMHHTAENESDWIVTSDGSQTLEFKRIGRIVTLRGTVDEGVNYTGLPAPIQGETYIPTSGGTISIRSNGTMVWMGTQEDRVSGIMYLAATPYQATDPNTIDDNPQS